MSTAEAVEVDEERVPGLLLLVTVLQGLECEESASPGKCSNNIFVLAKDVKSSAHVGLAKEILEDVSGVVGGFSALEHAASGLEELLCVSKTLP